MRFNIKIAFYFGNIAVLFFVYLYLLISFAPERDYITTDNSNSNSTKKIALFVQGFGLTDSLIWEDIFQCIANVGKAKTLADNFSLYPWVGVSPPEPFTFDIFISYQRSLDFSNIKSKLDPMGPNRIFGTPIVDNEGFDIKQFLDQLLLAESIQNTASSHYEAFLKIHTKSSLLWRQSMLESLCGSPSVVLTVIRTLGDKGDIGIVAPQGFVIQRSGRNAALAQPLRHNGKPGSNDFVFSKNLEDMRLLYRKMFNIDLCQKADLVFSAGTMFWSRYQDFRVKDWLKIMPWMSSRWSAEYHRDFLLEHAMERLFVSIPYLNNVSVAEIGPAVKPIGIYFPHYHEMPENNALHGKGLTDWSLLKSSTIENLAKPLSVEQGGFGYYDLTSVEIRWKQGEMAKAAGLHGFMYNHYWFVGKSGVNSTNHVMGKIPELMLEDGQPDIPFMFCWANEPSTDRWSELRDEKILLLQNYGEENEWEKHFYYLLPFFRHRNYIMVDRMPAFVINDIVHIKQVLRPMLNLWFDLALENGLNGLYFVYPLNDLLVLDKESESYAKMSFDAAFQYFPTIKNVYRSVLNSSSWSDVPIKSDQRQFWGGFTTFDNSLRQEVDPSVYHISPAQFKDDFRKSLKQMLTRIPISDKGQMNIPNLFFINAWNKWNEQAVLEPSDKYGFSYLSAIKEHLENQPLLKDRQSYYNRNLNLKGVGINKKKLV